MHHFRFANVTVLALSQSGTTSRDLDRNAAFTSHLEFVHKILYLEVLQEQRRDGVMLFHLNATVDHRKWPMLLNAFLVFWPVLATFHPTSLHDSAQSQTRNNRPQWPHSAFLQLAKPTQQVTDSPFQTMWPHSYTGKCNKTAQLHQTFFIVNQTPVGYPWHHATNQ